MNRVDWKGLKSLNIRDYEDKPKHRKAMGFFKHTAYRIGVSQAELLNMLNEKSLVQINNEFDFKNGNCVEIKLEKETTCQRKEVK